MSHDQIDRYCCFSSTSYDCIEHLAYCGDYSDEYDLFIARTGDIYKATWLIEGKTAAVGVGMEVENG